jgi:hypothetical protein
MNILVPYGVHGSEALAIELGRSLETDPIEGVTPLAANPEAIARGVRFVQENMALSFNDADPESPIYERREAARVLGVVAASDADMILDMHTTRYANADYIGIGAETDANVLYMGEMIGYTDAVVSNFGIPHHDSRALSFEMFETHDPSARQLTIRRWRTELLGLARCADPATAAREVNLPGQGMTLWSYQNAIFLGDLDPDDALDLDYSDGMFGMIYKEDARQFGLDTKIGGLSYTPYALNYGSAFLKYGVLGEFVFRIGQSRQTTDWRPLARIMNGGVSNWAAPQLIDS